MASIKLTPAIIEELGAILGPGGLVANAEELRVYECDAYTLEKRMPDIVVFPRSTAEVAGIVKVCAREKIPFIPRGAGTSLSGAVLAVEGGVMIALTRMTQIESIDYENQRALVQAGCVNAWITNAVKARGLL